MSRPKLPRFRGLTATLGALALAGSALLVSCSDASTGATTSASAAAPAPLLGNGGADLLECPTNTTQSTTGIIGPLGGVLSLGGFAVNIPAEAVSSLTTFTLTVPAGRYMKVDVTALGIEHFVFQQPVTVTVDYSRCPAGVTDGKALSVWYVAPVTDTPLENMGGVNDPAARTITFSTPHLSGYIIAD